MHAYQPARIEGKTGIQSPFLDQFGWNIIALIVFSAAPNPPIVTVTPLYDCGGLLEIESQATEGVGHDDH